MMKTQQKIWTAGLLLISLFYLTACKDDDGDNVPPMENEKSYPLTELSGSGVSGTVTFKKLDDQTTLVTIQLNNTEDGALHPAHIHSNNASEGGPVVIPLTSVDGTTGLSETEVTALGDGTPITYEELINFDGHVNVHLSADEISTYIAQGNIGSNYTENNNNSGGNNNTNPGGY